MSVRRRGSILARVFCALGAAASLTLWLIPGWSQDAVPVPTETARVVDTVGLLKPEERQALESSLAEYEAQKGTQIAILTIPSTAPEAIEQYGIRVADAWKVGRKNIADGVILIVAPDNPPYLGRLRIEVGRGLEGAVTDSIAKRIIDLDIAPRFRQGAYFAGLSVAVDHLKLVIAGEALPAPTVTRERSTGRGGSAGLGQLLFLAFIIISGVLSQFNRRGVAYLPGGRVQNRSSLGMAGMLMAPLLFGGAGMGRGGSGGFGGGFGGGGGGDFGGGGASGNW